ncbi:glucose dehydrogenase [Halobacteriales archaeon QS_6_71_20]|nr:MAG: glucose dehydrogenase [Halobacteriales archaeon QS_6_71_20]
MDRRTYVTLAGAAVTGGTAGCVVGGDGRSTDGDGAAGTTDPAGGDADADAGADDRPDVTVERVAEGFSFPWGLAFAPSGSELLVTERVGRLSVVRPDDGTTTPVEGTPEVFDGGQGGLLDVALHPAFPDDDRVYLTYSATDGGASAADGPSATHLGSGRLDLDTARIEGFEAIHVAEPFVESSGHFGSRVGFGPDGTLYVTVGDRQFKDFGPDHVAQDTTNELGTTLRLNPDGSVPDDNPFLDDPDVRDAIYSYGHRNAQGLAVHPETGEIWESEFGEQDGDEINVIEAGGNYGWPVADEGCTYGSGEPIGDAHDDREDVTAPAYSWECGSGGFPPSGATFHTGEAVPAWRGDLFVCGLASRALARFAVDGRDVELVSRLLTDRDWRIRAVAERPATGALYVAVDDGDAPVVRLVPDS